MVFDNVVVVVGGNRKSVELPVKDFSIAMPEKKKAPW